MAQPPIKCEWISERDAFHAFATHTGKTQSAGHIKPLHWYVAARLVVEGGFDPDWITPRPPFVVHKRVKAKGRSVCELRYDPAVATGTEQTILGGLKTKNVDVVVSIPGIGPVLAVSCKGVTKAFRNLTNRMEETIGECTNLHITYPALVLGYFAVLRGNRSVADVKNAPDLDASDDIAAELVVSDNEKQAELEDEVVEEGAETEKSKMKKNDFAFDEQGNVVDSITRFSYALSEMTGRKGIRDEISRYEAMTLVMIEPLEGNEARKFAGFPEERLQLQLTDFFKDLYLRYNERFVIGAPALINQTSRLFWNEKSPAFRDMKSVVGNELEYELRTP